MLPGGRGGESPFGSAIGGSFLETRGGEGEWEGGDRLGDDVADWRDLSCEKPGDGGGGRGLSSSPGAVVDDALDNSNFFLLFTADKFLEEVGLLGLVQELFPV